MCTGCHLAPGLESSELHRGLYPVPPRLDSPDRKRTPATDFWVIKHGIKASGMPAWGRSMEDRYIWGITAFLQKLPSLTEVQYRELVAQSPGHAHGGNEQLTPAVPAKKNGHDHHHGSPSTPHAH
jgi:mono/diheme cytochrome c family protein